METKKQSECLFSIKLKSGIVITGQSTYQVRDWLEMVSTIANCHSLLDDPDLYWSRMLADNLFIETNHAIVTINRIMN